MSSLPKRLKKHEEKDYFVIANQSYHRYFTQQNQLDVPCNNQYVLSLNSGSECIAALNLCERESFSEASISNPSFKKNYQSDELSKEFKRAKSILELPPDWDGDGSLAFKQDTLECAFLLVKNHAKWLYREFQITIDTPRFSPGPKGSIDIHWRRPSYELLVNIPRSDDQPATFYGDNYRNSSTKGSFPTSEVNHGFLQLWKP